MSMKNIAEILLAFRKRDHQELLELSAKFAKSHPFEYAYYRSQVSRMQEILGSQNNLDLNVEKQYEILSKVVDVLEEHRENWPKEDNLTIDAINQGTIPADSIVPHPRYSDETIRQTYQSRNDTFQRLTRAQRNQTINPLSQVSNIKHYVRKAQAVANVEMLFGLIKTTTGLTKINWIDIACGTGVITNAVIPNRHVEIEWSIRGYDLQSSKISYANETKAKGRSFFCEDVFEALTSIDYTENISIVSMFEFLEHVNDPLTIMRRLETLAPDYLIIGSPLAQRFNRPYFDAISSDHLWSFNLVSYSLLGELSGFKVVTTTETKVGKYLGGLDWLTVIFGPHEILSKYG